MPSPFPHRYETRLRWVQGRAALLSSPGAPELEGAPPPQFDGPQGRWSPETLLLASLDLCLMTTFMALAGRAGLTVLDYQSLAAGSLDRTAAGLAFTRIVQTVRLSVYGDDVERARGLMEKAKKHCLVSNALRTPPELELEVLPA
ncbi:MAG: OsmC family protein [Elusimicrobia bacterium]|nr:OsmC family protein [Elusimicrobiota bacterium]